nr:uncharacterized protein LOC120975023 [Aegilops tauschii subsp. strangulata]
MDASRGLRRRLCPGRGPRCRAPEGIAMPGTGCWPLRPPPGVALGAAGPKDAAAPLGGWPRERSPGHGSLPKFALDGIQTTPWRSKDLPRLGGCWPPPSSPTAMARGDASCAAMAWGPWPVAARSHGCLCSRRSRTSDPGSPHRPLGPRGAVHHTQAGGSVTAEGRPSRSTLCHIRRRSSAMAYFSNREQSA